MPNAVEYDIVEALWLKHEDICSKLNVDALTIQKSWKSYSTIRLNYSLDGDPLHWLSCALYVACRTSVTPTVQSGKAVEGNCVSLTRLLRLCNISLIQFFNKIKKWMEMASMSEEFRLRIERLERKFAVSTVLFQKFQPKFQEIFVGLTSEPKTSSKASKKQKLLPCTTNALFEFTWCLYICAKGEFQNSADDLVDMYHVLLSCLDFMFANAFLAKRTDLINPSFSGLPTDWSTENVETPSKAPCILSILCDLKEGLPLEAATTKQYSWRPVIESFFEKGILKGNHHQLSGLLDIGNFDVNLKNLNNLYETYALSVGEFDERIFLGEHANTDIGTNKVSEQDISKTIAKFGSSSKPYPPVTPLTGRRYLCDPSVTLSPVSAATNSIVKLRTYLNGCKPLPSPQLLQLFTECNINEESINNNVIQPCKKWMEILTKNLEESKCSHETILCRSNMVTCLHYKVLENILKEEHRKKPKVSLQTLLSQELFQLTVYACCVEIVLHAYSVQSMRFPRVLNIFALTAFHFYKIIELVVQTVAEKLSRDVIKHLNAVEEQALESLVWMSDSPLWEQLGNPPVVPPSTEVYSSESSFTGPLNIGQSIQLRRQTDGMESPVSTATERFLTPTVDQAKKQLFKDNIKPGQSLLVSNSPNQEPATMNIKEEKQEIKKLNRGSLVLFFRKFYSLAVVRMNDLCNKLRLSNDDLKLKIWACVEHSIMHQTHMMKDRHLDQILMCAVYVICKVSHNAANPVERTFTEIMRCYRQQPQADNHVYRSVLISNDVEGTPERGDLIKFYNKVYVQAMQTFALRFTGRHREELSLSPLPASRGTAARSSAGQRVSDRHNLYVTPLTSAPPTNHQLTYCFSRSPAKDLQAINSMLSCDMSVNASSLKRSSQSDGTISGGVVKRPAYGNTVSQGVARNLQSLMNRQAV